MFGITDDIKSLVIVCDEKTEPYANYLRQLISANDDTEDKVIGTVDGSVDASVYLEKEYLDNKFDMSLKQYVLFIGNNKTSNSESTSMKNVFSEHGMKYGWLGKRGMLTVDDKALTSEEYDTFFQYATNYISELEKIDLKRRKASNKNPEYKGDSSATEKMASGIINGVATTAVAVGSIALNPFIKVAGITAYGVGVGLDKVRITNKVKNQIKDQQFRVLVLKFYVEGLNSFLEG